MALSALTLLAILSPAGARASESPCVNEAIRLRQGSTFLPECRAYELVSPGSDPYDARNNNLAEHAARVSLSGSAVSYFAYYPANAAERGGFYYLSRRGDDGWTAEAQAPQDSASAAKQLSCEQELYFSPELSAGILGDGWDADEENPGEAPCPSSLAPLASAAPGGYGNLFLREGEGPYQLVNVTPEGATPGNAELQDATPSFDSILFGEKAQLTPGAPTGYDLYDETAGTVWLVSVLPDGEAVNGELADGHDRFEHTGEVAQDNTNYGQAPWAHAVSEDGQRVFFYADGNLYVRQNPTEPQSPIAGDTCTEMSKACTIEIDASQGGDGMSGGGVFWYASANGTRVLFVDESKLTANSNATTGKPDLYEYDLETGGLTDVTPGSKSEPSDARGFTGGAEDGTYVYFVADGDLTSGQENEHGATAQKRKPNLYLYHGNATTFIATLQAPTNVSDIGDAQDWQENGIGLQNMGQLTARVSSDGRYIAFNSVGEPTGFDNAPAQPADCETSSNAGLSASCDEIFLYDAAANTLVCASCGSSAPTGNAELPESTVSGFKAYGGPAYLSRNVLDDGRLFFTTPVSLAGQDKNGADDVYQYDEGALQLISSGSGAQGAIFEDASPSGSDVLFLTSQSLVGADTDNADSIYDARIGGGFPESEKAAVCAGENCHNPYHVVTPGGAPESATVTGSGNSVPKHIKHLRKKRNKKHAKHRKHKRSKTKRKTRRGTESGTGRGPR